jgi:hypothetical protein
MISKQHIEETRKQVLKAEKLLYPILDDLSIPIDEYNPKWKYACERRINEYKHLRVTIENLKSSLNWYESLGLVDIEVKD